MTTTNKRIHLGKKIEKDGIYKCQDCFNTYIFMKGESLPELCPSCDKKGRHCMKRGYILDYELNKDRTYLGQPNVHQPISTAY